MLLGYKIFYWGNDNKNNLIPFPESSKWTPLMLNAREHLAKYMKSNINNCSDIYIFDYVSKTFDLEFQNYFSFRYSLTKNFKLSDKIVILDSSYLCLVYENTKPRPQKRLIFTQLKVLFSLFRNFLINYYTCIKYGQNILTPQVLFLRKKIYPDLSLGENIKSALNSKTFEKTFTLFGRSKNKYGFYFLNSFKKSKSALNKSLLSIFQFYFKDLKFFYYNQLPLNLFIKFINQSLITSTTIELGASVYTGTLVDKPLFILLSRFKKQNQSIKAINEFFSFHPYRGFDYNHLDVYFTMNKIDAEMQNIFGGKINNVIQVPFFRGKPIKKRKNKLSLDLIEKTKNHKKIILATSTQVSENSHSQWSRKDTQDFVKNINILAESFDEYLFILKEKKGEFKFSYDIISNNLPRNIYVVRSEKPRDLINNQFEDLLSISNILISKAHQSTTIWQAIYNDIPSIAINEVHPKSFLRNYHYLEVGYSELFESFNYWLNINNINWKIFKNRIGKKINLLSVKDPYKIVAKNL